MLFSKEVHSFIIVAEEHSILRASKLLFLTPSPVCKRIKKLEEKLGFKLFERTKFGMELTSHGKQFYAVVSDVHKNIKPIEELYSSKK